VEQFNVDSPRGTFTLLITDDDEFEQIARAIEHLGLSGDIYDPDTQSFTQGDFVAKIRETGYIPMMVRGGRTEPVFQGCGIDPEIMMMAIVTHDALPRFHAFMHSYLPQLIAIKGVQQAVPSYGGVCHFWPQGEYQPFSLN